MSALDILEFPVSITNWILLSDFLKTEPQEELYRKLIDDYLPYIPAYKLYELFLPAAERLPEPVFQELLERLWKTVSAKTGRIFLTIL